MSDSPCYVVGPHFKVGDPVRVKGVRGTGKIVGSKFRAVVIEYIEYTVAIGKGAEVVAPDQLIAAE